MKSDEWRWLYNTIEKALLEDKYDLTCAHCPCNPHNLQLGGCNSRFCENIKRKLYLKLDKGGN